MRELFDELVADGEVAIIRLVEERRQEAVDLDFKGKHDPNTGILDTDDRKVLGRLLSAFSNSAGGVCVLGVDARKNLDQIDCATDRIPIANIERFAAEVTRAAGDLLMPKHEGIRVQAIPSNEQPGRGYLAICVERSERRPHRSEVKGDKQYYKRAGESTFAMEHYDIEDSFKRHATASLELKWRIFPGKQESAIGGPGVRTVHIEMQLSNPSSVTAKFPYLILSEMRGFTLSGNVTSPLVQYHFTDEGYHYNAGADRVIQPGILLPLVRLETQNISVLAGDGGQRYVSEFVLPTGIAKFGCDNSHQQVREFTIGKTEIIEKGIPGGFPY